MKMQKTNRIVKAISAVVASTFMLQSVGFAAPDIQPAQLPLFQKPMVSFEIPKSIAVISDSFEAGSQIASSPAASRNDKLVILLQDAHTNESAHMNIAKALDTMMAKDPALQFVFLEAGTGNDSLTFLRDKADLKKRQQVGREFMRKGYLSGSEYLDLTSNHDMVLWGVEDKKLYWEAVESYGKVAKGREKFQAHLSQVELAIETLEPQIFGPSLSDFDAKRESYLSEKLSLTDYLDVLMKQADIRSLAITHYPHLVELSKLKDQEKAIDFNKANEEQLKAISSFSKEDQDLLKEASLSKDKSSPFKIGSSDHKIQKAYYALLEEKLVTMSQGHTVTKSPSHQVTSEFPELKKYFSYLKAAEKIDPKSILDEQKLLETQVYDSLIKTQDERSLHTASESLRFLKGLFNLTLTPDEYRHYKKNKELYSIVNMTGFLNRKIMDLRKQYERVVFLEEGYEDYVKIAERYYQLTYERDFAFLENMLTKMKETNQKTSALITGGYHTPNLTALLRDKNISYVVVTPQVLQETNIKKYESVLLSQEGSHTVTKSQGHKGARHPEAKNTAGPTMTEGPQVETFLGNFGFAGAGLASWKRLQASAVLALTLGVAAPTITAQQVTPKAPATTVAAVAPLAAVAQPSTATSQSNIIHVEPSVTNNLSYNRKETVFRVTDTMKKRVVSGEVIKVVVSGLPKSMIDIEYEVGTVGEDGQRALVVAGFAQIFRSGNESMFYLSGAPFKGTTPVVFSIIYPADATPRINVDGVTIVKESTIPKGARLAARDTLKNLALSAAVMMGLTAPAATNPATAQTVASTNTAASATNSPQWATDFEASVYVTQLRYEYRIKRLGNRVELHLNSSGVNAIHAIVDADSDDPNQHTVSFNYPQINNQTFHVKGENPFLYAQFVELVNTLIWRASQYEQDPATKDNFLAAFQLLASELPKIDDIRFDRQDFRSPYNGAPASLEAVNGRVQASAGIDFFRLSNYRADSVEYNSDSPVVKRTVTDSTGKTQNLDGDAQQSPGRLVDAMNALNLILSGLSIYGADATNGQLSSSESAKIYVLSFLTSFYGDQSIRFRYGAGSLQRNNQSISIFQMGRFIVVYVLKSDPVDPQKFGATAYTIDTQTQRITETNIDNYLRSDLFTRRELSKGSNMSAYRDVVETLINMAEVVSGDQTDAQQAVFSGYFVRDLSKLIEPAQVEFGPFTYESNADGFKVKATGQDAEVPGGVTYEYDVKYSNTDVLDGFKTSLGVKSPTSDSWAEEPGDWAASMGRIQSYLEQLYYYGSLNDEQKQFVLRDLEFIQKQIKVRFSIGDAPPAGVAVSVTSSGSLDKELIGVSEAAARSGVLNVVWNKQSGSLYDGQRARHVSKANPTAYNPYMAFVRRILTGFIGKPSTDAEAKSELKRMLSYAEDVSAPDFSIKGIRVPNEGDPNSTNFVLDIETTHNRSEIIIDVHYPSATGPYENQRWTLTRQSVIIDSAGFGPTYLSSKNQNPFQYERDVNRAVDFLLLRGADAATNAEDSSKLTDLVARVLGTFNAAPAWQPMTGFTFSVDALTDPNSVIDISVGDLLRVVNISKTPATNSSRRFYNDQIELRQEGSIEYTNGPRGIREEYKFGTPKYIEVLKTDLSFVREAILAEASRAIQESPKDIQEKRIKNLKGLRQLENYLSYLLNLAQRYNSVEYTVNPDGSETWHHYEIGALIFSDNKVKNTKFFDRDYYDSDGRVAKTVRFDVSLLPDNTDGKDWEKLAEEGKVIQRVSTTWWHRHEDGALWFGDRIPTQDPTVVTRTYYQRTTRRIERSVVFNIAGLLNHARVTNSQVPDGKLWENIADGRIVRVEDTWYHDKPTGDAVDFTDRIVVANPGIAYRTYYGVNDSEIGHVAWDITGLKPGEDGQFPDGKLWERLSEEKGVPRVIERSGYKPPTVQISYPKAQTSSPDSSRVTPSAASIQAADKDIYKITTSNGKNLTVNAVTGDISSPNESGATVPVSPNQPSYAQLAFEAIQALRRAIQEVDLNAKGADERIDGYERQIKELETHFKAARHIGGARLADSPQVTRTPVTRSPELEITPETPFRGARLTRFGSSARIGVEAAISDLGTQDAVTAYLVTPSAQAAAKNGSHLAITLGRAASVFGLAILNGLVALSLISPAQASQSSTPILTVNPSQVARVQDVLKGGEADVPANVVDTFVRQNFVAAQAAVTSEYKGPFAAVLDGTYVLDASDPDLAILSFAGGLGLNGVSQRKVVGAIDVSGLNEADGARLSAVVNRHGLSISLPSNYQGPVARIVSAKRMIDISLKGNEFPAVAVDMTDPASFAGFIHVQRVLAGAAVAPHMDGNSINRPAITANDVPGDAVAYLRANAVDSSVVTAPVIGSLLRDPGSVNSGVLYGLSFRLPTIGARLSIALQALKGIVRATSSAA